MSRREIRYYREVRKTLLQIDQLYENILYLDKYNIRSYEELLVREAKVIEMGKCSCAGFNLKERG